MFITPIAIKGLLILAKAIAGKAALVKVTGYVIAKSIAAYGLSATIGTAITVGTVVGGVAWTGKRIKHLRKAFKALEEDNIDEAIYYFARLLHSVHGIDVHGLADTVQSCLEKVTSFDKAAEVHDLILEFGSEITAAALEMN